MEMAGSYTVTSSESWFGRIMSSIKSVLVGLVLFLAAFPLLFWNEGNAVRTAKSLEEGGGIETVTTYNYQQTWSDDPIDSSSFQKPDGHSNPTSFPIPSATLVAQKVTLGAFTLPPSMIDHLDKAEEVRLDENAGSLPAS